MAPYIKSVNCVHLPYLHFRQEIRKQGGGRKREFLYSSWHYISPLQHIGLILIKSSILTPILAKSTFHYWLQLLCFLGPLLHVLFGMMNRCWKLSTCSNVCFNSNARYLIPWSIFTSERVRAVSECWLSSSARFPVILPVRRIPSFPTATTPTALTVHRGILKPMYSFTGVTEKDRSSNPHERLVNWSYFVCCFTHSVLTLINCQISLNWPGFDTGLWKASV